MRYFAQSVDFGPDRGMVFDREISDVIAIAACKSIESARIIVDALNSIAPIDWWQPIDTAPVPPRDVLKFDTWPCLLQDKHGNVVGGHAAYVKDRLGPNPDRLHRSRPPTYRIQWYHGLRIAGRSMVFKPVYWMPLPAPRKD